MSNALSRPVRIDIASTKEWYHSEKVLIYPYPLIEQSPSNNISIETGLIGSSECSSTDDPSPVKNETCSEWICYHIVKLSRTSKVR